MECPGVWSVSVLDARACMHACISYAPHSKKQRKSKRWRPANAVLGNVKCAVGTQPLASQCPCRAGEVGIRDELLQVVAEHFVYFLQETPFSDDSNCLCGL